MGFSMTPGDGPLSSPVKWTQNLLCAHMQHPKYALKGIQLISANTWKCSCKVLWLIKRKDEEKAKSAVFPTSSLSNTSPIEHILQSLTIYLKAGTLWGWEEKKGRHTIKCSFSIDDLR